MTRRRLAGTGLVVMLIAVLTWAESAAVEPASLERRPFELLRATEDLVIVEWDRAALLATEDRSRSVLRGMPLRANLDVDLDVEPFEVTGPRTRFVLGRRGRPDVPLDFDPTSISLFRGRVVGRPGSHVFLALSEDETTGYVDLGGGDGSYRLSSRNRAGESLEPGTVTIFETRPGSGPAPDVPLCGVGPTAVAPAVGGSTEGSPTPRRGLKHLELAVETDYEYFALFDGAAEAATYLMLMYAQVSDIYMRDVDTRVELTFARIWDNPSDLFNVVDPSPLSAFRDYWNANMGGVQRDVAQLFSGRRDYPFGGQASLNSLCNANAYSVVGYAQGFFPDPARPSPYNYDIRVTAHELGHNAGTTHTHDLLIDSCDDPLSTPQRGTIMSYCGQTWSGGNANGDLYFHARVQQNIESYIGSVACVIDDCNQNGQADNLDIAQLASPDVNANGIPDECEDCNGNAVLDDEDIGLATSTDLNANGVPDECEPDCNFNLTPDDRDISSMNSSDAYGNDVPDECEEDCDLDFVSDYSEIQSDMTLDLDRDTLLDACQDCDGDATPDLAALAGAHHAWVASGIAASDVREFHPTTGVLTAVSGGGPGATTDEAQDLIVLPDGRVLVTSRVDHRVLEFDVDGNYIGDLVAASGGGLTAPTGLTLAADETTLLVSSSGTDSVLAFDVDNGGSLGAFVATSSGGLVAPFGLIVGPGGNLFVTSDAGEILEYDGQSGAFVRVFVDAANNDGLDQPRGIAFKPDGNLLVASFGTNEVLEFDGLTGAPLGKWARSGTSGVLTQVSPWGIRIGPNGNVFVARTGDDFGSTATEDHDHHHLNHQHLDLAEDHDQLHLTNAQIYEFDATNGNFLRSYIGGNDHGLFFPTGFDFVPGWDLDCNLNLLPDSCDISSGASDDGDQSGVPDECESDCNANGMLDRLEIIPYGSLLDCNANLAPDSCDIASGSSDDCSGNGIPDECEPDCNFNGIADSCDVAGGASRDCNANDIPDECDAADDFENDIGWLIGDPADTATTGVWERVDPIGSEAQPEDDRTPAGRFCFVTGQGIRGGAPGLADVDGGRTTLTSPPFDLAGSVDAEVRYWLWYSNSTGDNPGEDVLTVEISNDGGLNWVLLDTVGPDGQEATGGWRPYAFRVTDHITPTISMVVRFIADDQGAGSIIEAAVDDFVILAECCLSDTECDDGRSCTADACAGGECVNALDPGSCLIDDSCYVDGAPNPANACEICEAAMPSSWTASLPVEVEELRLEPAGSTRLSWTDQGPTFGYDIVGGDLSSLQASGSVNGALCVIEDVGGSSWDDARPDPPLGDGYYYLVRSQKVCATGSYGEASAGAERLPVGDCL